MPVTKGEVTKKTKKYVSKHKNDETDYGRIDLPPGINNGVARLSKCYFDKYKSGPNEGQIYFRAEAVVLSPESHDGIKTKGLTTSIMEAMCDTTTQAGKETSEEDHIASIMNSMRKLGYDTSEMDSDELWDAAEELQEEKPVFKFVTTPRKDTKGVVTGAWENWRELTDEDVDDEDDEVEDDTEEDDTEEEEVEEIVDDEVEEEEEEEVEEGSSELDLASLAVEADEGDEEAQTAIATAAESFDIDPNEIETWTEVVEAIESKSESEESEDDAEEEEESEDEESEEGVEVEENYFYKPPKKRKRILVEVTKVVASKRTAEVEDEEGNTFKGVSWDDLHYDES